MYVSPLPDPSSESSLKYMSVTDSKTQIPGNHGRSSRSLRTSRTETRKSKGSIPRVRMRSDSALGGNRVRRMLGLRTCRLASRR